MSVSLLATLDSHGTKLSPTNSSVYRKRVIMVLFLNSFAKNNPNCVFVFSATIKTKIQLHRENQDNRKHIHAGIWIKARQRRRQ